MSDQWTPDDVPPEDWNEVEPEWGFAEPSLEASHEVQVPPTAGFDEFRQDLADAVDDASELVDVASLKLQAVELAEAETWRIAEAAHRLSKAQRAQARALAALAAYDARPPASSADDAPPATLVYSNVDQWVREWLKGTYRRKIDGNQSCWAAEWWRYDEAVARLEALWRAWESLRLDPAVGMSSWFRDHADHHMPILLSPAGPFSRATGKENTNGRGDPLPYAPPPAGMFTDEKTRP